MRLSLATSVHRARYARLLCTKPEVQTCDLPDYNTSVNVHEHKLQRPTAKKDSSVAAPPRQKWEGLKGLHQRTKDSLIPDTLKEMDESEDFKVTAANLRKLGQAKLTKEERLKRQRALDNLGIPSFTDFLNLQRHEKQVKGEDEVLRKRQIQQLQLTAGLYCNQACNHCHVESSPRRPEMMDRQTADRCLYILKNSPSVEIFDITGGAPELCDQFKHLAIGGRTIGKDVIVRSNLTALLEPGQEDTAQFFADNGLHVIASLPCYSAKNVNTQRGKGVFDRSIMALIKLNELGYGSPGSGLVLDLVYNPLGAFLPPPQLPLEDRYREELKELFDVTFNNLYTITNMPIKRFADFLYRRGELQDYMELLVRNYNLATVDHLMCRNVLSVSWDGQIYDCDFNQQLALNMKGAGKCLKTVHDIDSCDDVVDTEINVDNHCYGCTAGMGSS